MSAKCGIIDTLRKPKILDMSIFDWFFSLLFAVLVGKYWLKLKTPVKWILWIVFWTLLGVFIHYIFGVPTMFGYYLGLCNKPVRKCQ